MASISEDGLRPYEIVALEAGLPDLAACSDTLLVPFEAVQLRLAEPLWINRRWFLERGIDVTDASTSQRVGRWLTDTFGYAVQSTDDLPDAFTSLKKTMSADRYGNTSGYWPHGGSGRVATLGRFQVKGVGSTPLVGTGTDWLHSHGCAWLEEGLREALFSEISAAEFPHSAIPVIAVLDTGLVRKTPAGLRDPSGRRALIVRPAVARVAHFERAPLFIDPIGKFENSQEDDVRRTKDVVRRFSIPSHHNPLGVNCAKDLVTLFERVAAQVAFGRVHRLFNGGYFSSNISLSASLLDFGAMRALPDWSKARVLNHGVGFGDEMAIVNDVVRSAIFYFNKYKRPSEPPLDEGQVREHVTNAFDEAMSREFLRLWGINEDDVGSSCATSIASTMLNYMQHQQHRTSDYQTMQVVRQPWLHDVLASIDFERSDLGLTYLDAVIERQTLAGVFSALLASSQCGDQTDGHTGANAYFSWLAAMRYLEPRIALEREELQAFVQNRVVDPDPMTKPRPQEIAVGIRRLISVSRRHWPYLPGDLAVLGQWTDACSSALVCLQKETAQLMLWMEGILLAERVYLYGLWYEVSNLSPYAARQHGGYWSGCVSIKLRCSSSDINIDIDGRSIRVPPMAHWYVRPETIS